MINFKNKNVLITGASGGIGGELVKKFVSLEANVLGSGTKAEKLDRIKKKYPNIKVKRFDISEHSRIEDFIDNVSLELGGLDILINSAGTNADNLSVRMKEDEWKKVIDVNLTSTFLLSKYAIKKMLKNKFGRIVNITSVVGHTGNLGQSNYAASKAGIIGMSKSFAIEYAKKNITINCVSPGFIVSEMTMNIAEKVKLYLTSRIPMGKLGTGEDVSNCVAFLSSEQASYVTGETIHVNGGMYMS
jgi:3-oxoacyl-[acyl-carrier protein] reductase